MIAQIFAIIYVAMDVFKTSRSEPKSNQSQNRRSNCPAQCFRRKDYEDFGENTFRTHMLIYTEVFGENFLMFSPKILEEITQGILTKVFAENHLIFSVKISSFSAAESENPNQPYLKQESAAIHSTIDTTSIIIHIFTNQTFESQPTLGSIDRV